MPRYHHLDAKQHLRFAFLPKINTKEALNHAIYGLLLLGMGALLIFYFVTFIPLGLYLIALGIIDISQIFSMSIPHTMFNRLTLTMGSIIGVPAFALAGFFIGSILFPLPVIGIYSGAILGTLLGMVAGTILGPLLSFSIAHFLDALDITDPGGVIEAKKAVSRDTLAVGMLLGGIIGLFFIPIGPIIGMLVGGVLVPTFNALWAGVEGSYDSYYNFAENKFHPHHSMHQLIVQNIVTKMPDIKTKPEDYHGSKRIGEFTGYDDDQEKVYYTLPDVDGVQEVAGHYDPHLRP